MKDKLKVLAFIVRDILNILYFELELDISISDFKIMSNALKEIIGEVDPRVLLTDSERKVKETDWCSKFQPFDEEKKNEEEM